MLQKQERLLSLDIFRGLTIAAMILVNNPGSWSYVYAPLEHAEWFGLTPTDLIFPFFLFIVGVAIKLSLDKYLADPSATARVLTRIVRRTVILFLLGLFLNFASNADWASLRIPGVLQRIAVCYFFAALIYVVFAKRSGVKAISWGPFAVISALLLLVYSLLMLYVPVPGYGAGQLNSPPGNLAAYLDRLLFGAHLWQYSKTWDPEGLLSTLPALATTLSGVLTGWWLTSGHEKRKIVYGLIGSGVAGIFTGLIVGLIIPIGKKLWTPSFMLLTSGAALVLLAVIYFYVDIKGGKKGTQPFIVFGANPISAYVLSSLGATLMWKISFTAAGETTGLKALVYDQLLQPLFGNYGGSLAFALLYVALWWGVMTLFYKKGVFIKI